MTSKSVNLGLIGVTLFLTATGLKLGAKGKVANTQEDVSHLLFNNGLNNGERRKIRKSLRAAGLTGLAASGTRTQYCRKGNSTPVQVVVLSRRQVNKLVA